MSQNRPGTEKGMERVNILSDFINYFLLLFNFIPQPGQLLLVGFPVTLHLLLQGLLRSANRARRQTQTHVIHLLIHRENTRTATPVTEKKPETASPSLRVDYPQPYFLASRIRWISTSKKNSVYPLDC